MIVWSSADNTLSYKRETIQWSGSQSINMENESTEREMGKERK